MKAIVLILLSWAMLVYGDYQTQAQDLSIDWEVKHRFRFFQAGPDNDPSIFFRMQQAAWDDVVGDQQTFDPKRAISLLERKLNDQSWLQDFYVKHQQELNIRRNELERGGHARWGWAKHAVRNQQTCWNWRQQWHSSCKSDALGQELRTDYVKPQRHTVVARVAGLTTGENLNCVWSTDVTSVFLGYSGRTQQIVIPCDQAVNLRIPFKPHPETGISTSTKVKVSVEGDDTKFAIARIRVRDMLVVGIGDSYSSGEGNPDIPVIMSKAPVEVSASGFRYTSPRYQPFAFEDESRTKLVVATQLKEYQYRDSNGDLQKANPVLPHRQNINTPAKWLDRNCHRSLYSYHMRSAIQLALSSNRQTAVTFLGYACSGAKLTDGILLDYDGIEEVNERRLTRQGKLRRAMPQLARLIEELCASTVSLDTDNWKTVGEIKTGLDGKLSNVVMPKCGNNEPKDYLRPVDAMIFSIGGNDVGFLPIIVDAVLSGSSTFDEAGKELKVSKGIIANLGTMFLGHDTNVALEERLPQLPDRFATFSRVLDAVGLPIKTSKIDNKTYQNIVLTAFPRIERNQDGKVCAYAPDGSSLARKREASRERIAGMTMLPSDKWLTLNGEKMNAASSFSDALYGVIKDAAVTHNYVFVDEHREVFARHGMCAQGSDADTNPHERHLAPFFISSNRFGKFWHRKSKPHSAYLYDCYRSRQSWIRQFDDAFYCANTKHFKRFPPQGRDEFSIAFSSLGGPVHPTAEGHSHVADAVWQALQKLGLIARQLN